jgi:hypothetical protein
VLLWLPGMQERFAAPGAPPPWLFVALAPVALFAGVRLLPKRGVAAD